MSLSKRIAEYEPPRIGGKCRTCLALEESSPEDRAALQAALADPRYSNAGLSRILKEEGFQIQESTVRRHRRGECTRES